MNRMNQCHYAPAIVKRTKQRLFKFCTRCNAFFEHISHCHIPAAFWKVQLEHIQENRDPRPPSSATQTRGFAVAPPTKRRRRYPRRPPRPSPRPYPCRCRCRSSQRVRGFCRDITITKFLFFSPLSDVCVLKIHVPFIPRRCCCVAFDVRRRERA